MLYNRCTGIYKFGNNTYPRRIRRRSNLGHIFREKSPSNGPGNTVPTDNVLLTYCMFWYLCCHRIVILCLHKHEAKPSCYHCIICLIIELSFYVLWTYIIYLILCVCVCVCACVCVCVWFCFSVGFVHMYVYVCFQEEKSLWLDQISSYISIG
jgi:hypothetical protein